MLSSTSTFSHPLLDPGGTCAENRSSPPPGVRSGIESAFSGLGQQIGSHVRSSAGYRLAITTPRRWLPRSAAERLSRLDHVWGGSSSDDNPLLRASSALGLTSWSATRSGSRSFKNAICSGIRRRRPEPRSVCRGNRIRSGCHR